MLDAVLEFAHVARPVVAHEHVDGGRAESRDVLAVLEVHLLDKVVGEQKDVGLALREVGQVYLEYVEAVVEVLKVRPCMNSRSRAWLAGESSATSSRNSVPPLACSALPICLLVAPVNAPRS